MEIELINHIAYFIAPLVRHSTNCTQQKSMMKYVRH